MVTLALIARLWRYPIKSLKRESLQHAYVESDGIRGDRLQALFVRDGHPRIQKTYRGKENNVLHTVKESVAAGGLAMQKDVSVELRAGARYFDDAPISIVLDTWLHEAELMTGRELDPQRFRPNVFARATGDFKEPEGSLKGQILRIGAVLLRVRGPIHRCVTVTYDVDSGEPDPAVLRTLAEQRNNTMGIYCDVVQRGDVKLGDPIDLVTEG